jgi:pyridoxal phosphate enzyme (YggS family)
MSENAYGVSSVLERVARAAERSGRSPDEITLVAVSKTKPISAIIEAYEAGVRHFGENRAAELQQKAAELSHLPDLQWHFIGRLQTRQSQPVADHAAMFHAVDRIKIAKRLSSQLSQLGRTLPLFIQVNVSGEETKAGFECSDWQNDGEQREKLIQAVETIAQLPSLEIRGLMTMAPWGAPEAATRHIFRRVRELSEWVQTAMPDLKWPDLSMGMSGDFETAIEEGSTYIRVGSAIFGARQYLLPDSPKLRVVL